MALPASANDWDALDQTGAVAIMRHALAPGTGDPADFELDDCSTQRILSDAGRD
ncbi:MAG: histidine phosphatase family protein, partial [Rhizobiales bacterium]|nr:histidine phosphatase family protein [Hyphomicrobiales bacterium]